MRHHDSNPPIGNAIRKTPDVRPLAEKALVQIAVRSVAKKPVLCADMVDRLSAALLQPTDGAHCDVVAEMAATGTTLGEITDLYIPECARRIGDLWVSDQCSFVDVTIAASRLQRLLRTTARGFDPAVFLQHPPERALIVIPEGEQHTLGGALAANQLQRAGIGAEIAVGAEDKNLRSQIASTSYALIGISVGSEKSLDGLGALIDMILNVWEQPPAFLLGGWAIDTYPDAIETLPIVPVGTTVAEGITYLSQPPKIAANGMLATAN